MSKRGEKLDMFGGGSDLQSVSDEIYGSSELPDSGRVVARPTPINQIWADPKQPRRAIPLSIRLHWDGNPDSVPDLLNDWRMVAQQMIGETLDVVKLLNGEGDGLDSDKFPSVAEEYLDLVRLAAHIRAHKLENPITIIESDSKLIIEAGERRWLAFHLLSIYVDDKWSRIPAIKEDSKDSLWRQAGENTKRRNLNAISLSRQFALLLMDLLSRQGVVYQDYEDIVTTGAADRRFYAQVADGNRHGIPRGMGEAIQSAMGGLSKEQLSQYRRLLKLTDDESINDILWLRADTENWPERAMREIAEVWRLTPVNLRKIIEGDNWTIDDLRALKDLPPPQRLPVTTEWMNKRVMTQHGITGTVVDVNGEWIVIAKDGSGQRYQYAVGQLTVLAERPGAPPVVPAPRPSPQPAPQAAPAPTVTFEVGDMVKTRLGNMGTVTAVNGRMVSLDVPGRGNTTQYADQLTLVKKSGGPQINEDDIEEDVDPDAPAPQREWREGWTDGEGGNNEQSSDKADSQPQQLPKLLFPMGSDDWGFLDALNDLAIFADEDEISETINDLFILTDLDAKQLQKDGQLKPKLDEAYDQLKAAMDQWLNVQFPAILQKVMDAAQ